MERAAIKAFLDEQLVVFNAKTFVEDDPIGVPHRFSRRQDIEIMAFWVAVIAWGQRKSIIKSGLRLAELMDNAPHQFIVQHEEKDRARFADFKHRTFQPLDAFYFLEFLQWFYRQHPSLEVAFAAQLSPNDAHVEQALVGFHRLFFSLEAAPLRTRKHIPTPARGSACKRLNMFLRWMVRHDAAGVDFGLWQRIKPAQLIVPLDVHVERVARRLGLIKREKSDWLTAVELTQTLREFDEHDPVKYDFALFGLGVMKQVF